jgi:DNA-binding transcriptional ArsR family regulator
MEPETTSTSIDSNEIEKAANRLKAIAHPTRIAIIELLTEKTKLSVTEIYKTLKLEQAVASNHLNILKEKGILSSKRNGQKIIYSVKSKTMNTVLTCVKKIHALD